MVVLGHDSTRARDARRDDLPDARRHPRRAPAARVADLPFGSYQVSDEQALENAIRFVKEGGADASSSKGAGRMLSRVRAITDADIPVMGHIGLTPQTATMLGGFKAQGRTAAQAQCGSTRTRSRSRTRAASRSCSKRCRRRSPRDHARARHPDDRHRRRRRHCDGQVLVWHDLLGLYDGPHAALRQAVRRARTTSIGDAVAQYAADVRSGAFPEEQHTYGIPDEELALFEEALCRQRA